MLLCSRHFNDDMSDSLIVSLIVQQISTAYGHFPQSDKISVMVMPMRVFNNCVTT